jgi:hypothetical protein
MFQEIANSSLWNGVLPKFIAAFLAGLVILIIRLAYVEWRSRTRLDVKLKWRNVGTESQINGKYIHNKEKQNHPVLQVRHQGRRDKARITKIIPKVCSGIWLCGKKIKALDFKVIEGQQPFSQGEEVLLQLAGGDLLDELRHIDDEEAIAVRFILSDAVTDKHFNTPKFEVTPACLKPYNPLADIASSIDIESSDLPLNEVTEKAGDINEPNVNKKHGINEDEEGKVLSNYGSSELFERRLSDAFPGLRDLKVITDSEVAVERLGIVLRDPLYRENPNSLGGHYFPFWWFRGGNNSIDRFQKLSKTKCLIGIRELEISRIVAVRSFSNGERNFLYIESAGQAPVGCYEYDEGEIEQKLQATQEGFGERNYSVSEEYGIWQGYPITREEYDDGAALIANKPTKTSGSELRVRYLTPHNILICSKISVVNNNQFDQKLSRMMNFILKGENDISDLTAFIGDLPRNPHADNPGMV